MKTRTSSARLSLLVCTVALVLATRTVPAQEATSTVAVGAATTPALSYGVSEVIQLSQAKVGDATIINYIQSSGSSYGLDASQIIYLKQQGVSDPVINTMLNQPRTTQVVAPELVPVSAEGPAPSAPVIYSQPTPVCVRPAPVCLASSSVYVIPDTQTYNYNTHSSSYYPGYYYSGYRPTYYSSCRPAVSFCFSFGGGYRGGQFHGGWHR